MVRPLSRSLIALCLATGALFTAGSAADAFDGRHEGRFERGHDRGFERRHDWRPGPPAFHGYWGHRRWQRWHEARRFYGPPPGHYRHGWR